MNVRARRIIRLLLQRLRKPGQRAKEIAFVHEAIAAGYVLTDQPGVAFLGVALGASALGRFVGLSLLGLLAKTALSALGSGRANRLPETGSQPKNQCRGHGCARGERQPVASDCSPKPIKRTGRARYHWLIAQVPFVDVMNTMLDTSLPLTTEEWMEWGNPHNKSDWDYMIQYSPYDNVKPRAYPNMLIDVSITAIVDA